MQYDCTQVVYPLATTTFTPEQYSAILQSAVLQDGLPKVGLGQTMLHALVHGQLCYVGLDIPNLYMEQLVSQLTLLLQHG